MEFKANKIEVLYSLDACKLVLTLDRKPSPAEAEELSKNQAWRCGFKKYRERRSLDANAYAWVLLDKLAAALQIDKETLYRRAVRNIGGNSTVVCVVEAAADKVIQSWEDHGLGWLAEKFESKIPGCVNVRLTYGSSVYDTEQMSRLIDYIIQDCEAVGIETKSPDEIKAMLKLWGQND